MQYLRIGEVDFPQLGLGLYSMRGDVLKNAVDAALELGYSWLDTAYRYENEKELGALLSCHEKIDLRVSSKLSGLQYVGERKYFYLNKISAKRALKGTLSRLGMQSIDMYMLHSPFRHFEKAFSDLLRLKEAGLVQTVGVSGFGEDQLQTIHAYCGEWPQFNMIECHPFYSNKDVIGFCKEHGIQVIARSPFAHGHILPELQKDSVLGEMAKSHQVDIPQLVLRWIVQQGMAVMTRSANPKHIKDNMRVFDFELSEQECGYMDGLNIDKSFGAK